ncbi:hypothetical protein B566_EDAN012636 [Ephemera danica]|nr:hypothetical protein B566_EDAN012636 [Ephemera danica]
MLQCIGRLSATGGIEVTAVRSVTLQQHPRVCCMGWTTATPTSNKVRRIQPVTPPSRDREAATAALCSGAVGMAHLDGSGVDECVLTMVQRVQELSLGYPEGRLELQLIVEVDLTLCCIGELNTTIRGGIQWPIIYGIGVNVKTGEIFPASFMDKGPEQPLRKARHFTGGRQVLDIYDSNLGMLRIGPFNYEPLRGADLWLQQSDDFILQHLSTSPDVEPPHYVMEVRATLRHILENPFPAVTIFPDNRPHYYRRDDHGNWVHVRY